MASWRAPDPILETPGFDFGGSRDHFFEILECFLACLLEVFPAIIPPMFPINAILQT